MYKGMSLIFTLILALLLSAQSNQSFSLAKIAYNEGVTQLATEENGITVETKIVIEKEDEQVKIVFWQETQNGFFFKDVDWKGDVILELMNGDNIKLTDKDTKGHTMHPGAHIGPYFVPDLYQRFISYYLPNSACKLLKKYPLAKVIYYVDDEFETAKQVIYVNDTKNAIAHQLASIGK